MQNFPTMIKRDMAKKGVNFSCTLGLQVYMKWQFGELFYSIALQKNQIFVVFCKNFVIEEKSTDKIVAKIMFNTACLIPMLYFHLLDLKIFRLNNEVKFALCIQPLCCGIGTYFQQGEIQCRSTLNRTLIKLKFGF